jgi:hypothetical protein
MNEDAKFICERLRQAVEDFTSLGRWGWGLLITFLTHILIESAKAGGNLFKPPQCGAKDANEIARGFLLVIVIAAIAYFYFLAKAKQRVVSARDEVKALNTQGGSGLEFAIRTAPTDHDLKVAMCMRMAIFGVLAIVWLMMFDILTRFSLAGLWCMLTFG